MVLHCYVKPYVIKVWFSVYIYLLQNCKKINTFLENLKDFQVNSVSTLKPALQGKKEVIYSHCPIAEILATINVVS